MAKKKEKKSANIKTIDVIGFFTALFYMQSVSGSQYTEHIPKVR